MQTTFKLFFSFLLCLILSLMSGCGGGVPKLSPAEQAEVDKILTAHGRSSLVHYIETLPRQRNTDTQRALKYIKYFISKGADVNARDDADNTPLHAAVEIGNVEIAMYLVSRGADINALRRGWSTPLDLAKGNGEMVRHLLSKGAKNRNELRR